MQNYMFPAVEIFRQLQLLATADFIIYAEKNDFNLQKKYIKELIKTYIFPLSHSCSAALKALLFLSEIQSRPDSTPADKFKVTDLIDIKKTETDLNKIITRKLFNNSIFIDVHKRPELEKYDLLMYFTLINNEEMKSINIQIYDVGIHFQPYG